jgi:hypothetical protein
MARRPPEHDRNLSASHNLSLPVDRLAVARTSPRLRRERGSQSRCCLRASGS